MKNLLTKHLSVLSLMLGATAMPVLSIEEEGLEPNRSAIFRENALLDPREALPLSLEEPCTENRSEEWRRFTHNLFIDVQITPATLNHVQRCQGHRESRAFGTKPIIRWYDHCGCGSYSYVVQERQVNIVREEWVGEALPDEGLYELVSVIHPPAETRILFSIDGAVRHDGSAESEPITRDVWQRIYTYKRRAA